MVPSDDMVPDPDVVKDKVAVTAALFATRSIDAMVNVGFDTVLPCTIADANKAASHNKAKTKRTNCCISTMVRSFRLPEL